MRFAILISALLCNLASADVTLVKDGKSDWVIVLPTQSPPANARGAHELQSFIEQISGAKLPIVDSTNPLPAHAIVIGMNLKRIALPNEAFMIETVGEHIYIGGGGTRGAMYGCTSFLEKLGVRFLTPTVTRVPKTPTITLAPINEMEAPAFEYREPFFFEAFDKGWAAHLKMNGNHHRLDESTGGKVTYGQFVHTFDTLIPQTEFDKHPEYFPLINGKRTNGYVQRCLTNPEVLKMSIARVREWIKENPNATIFSVSQNDTASWCQCDKCAELTKKFGAHSGLYLWFVNQVAEAIEKDHPDKLIDTLAYQFTEAPPTGITPRKNVRVRLCPIACCDAHPYEQCEAPANKAFVANLAAWSKITDSLYVWHYNTNFANYLLPFPDFSEFPDSIRLYQRSGVKGIFFEGDYAPGGGGSDAELRSYVMAKLLWNPSLDADALVNDWMDGIYGKASKPMRQWFDLLHEHVRDPKRHLFIYDAPDKPYVADEVLSKGNALHAQARQFAAGDPVAIEYIEKSELCLRYAKLMRHPRLGDEFDTFMKDIRKRGITQLREGQDLEQFEAAYRKNAAGK